MNVQDIITEIEAGECLRPTPETDAAEEAAQLVCPSSFADFARNLERQRNEAREENARLREALEKIERRHCIMGSTGDYIGAAEHQGIAGVS